MSILRAPEPLADTHDLDLFDCGVESLNHWLKSHARANEASGASRTCVLCEGLRVIGYFSLAASTIEHTVATGRLRRNMPDPIPAVLIARLALDRTAQGRGYGKGLMKDAVRRAARAAGDIGVRALLVHALSPEAKAFYERFGFRVSPLEPMTLMISLDEVTRRLR